MARKYFTLVVLLMFACVLVQAQDTKGDVQSLCYSATGVCGNGYSNGSDQSMIDMVANGAGFAGLPGDLFTGAGTLPGYGGSVVNGGGSGNLSSGVLDGPEFSMGMSNAVSGWINQAGSLPGRILNLAVGNGFTPTTARQQNVLNLAASELGIMPIAGFDIPGGLPGEGGIPLPESMRNFSNKDLLLGHYDQNIVEFKVWGGIKGQLGKVGVGNEGNPDFIIPQVRKTIANGGLVRFNLKGFSIKAAMDPESTYYWGRSGNWTSQEYHAIITHWGEFQDHVLFYTGPYPY